MSTIAPAATIAVLEDEPLTRRMLGALLERHEFTPMLFDSCESFLSSLGTHTPDIALLDISIARGATEGIDLCRTLRQRFAMNVLPVLMVTSHTDEEVLVESFAAGANDYIEKPIRPVELIARIRTQLRVVRSTRALVRMQQEIAAQQRLETVGLFATGVAHNLNNALGIIQGSAEMLTRSASDPLRQRKYADLIMQATKRSSELISNLRVLSVRPEEVSCDAAFIAHSTLALTRTLAKDRIVMDLQIEPDIPAFACPGLNLAVALTHLLRRAIQTIEGEGWIRIRLFERQAGVCCLSVQDSGSGIPEELRRSAFVLPADAAEGSVPPPETPQVQGLWLIGQVLERSGGSIRIAESGAFGTTIELVIPAFAPIARPSESCGAPAQP